MDAKSVITRPSGGQRLDGPGFHQISGLAWSGRGRVRRVEVSTDGGRYWAAAQLLEPVLPLAHTRFRLDWRWDGMPATPVSRCIDESGDVQPTRAALIAVRGGQSSYHNNAIQGWFVRSDGPVENVDVQNHCRNVGHAYAVGDGDAARHHGCRCANDTDRARP